MPVYLPDQITITHGPTQLLGRFILAAYEEARGMGFLLSWRTDMGELRDLNRANLDTWFPLMTLFDPDFCAVDESNAAWIEARDRSDDLAAVIALRLFDWTDEPDTTLKDEVEAGRVFIAHPGDGERWEVTAPSAEEIGGRVFYPGALWIHPKHRHSGLGYLLCHLAIALGWTYWNPDFAASIIQLHAVRRGVAHRYGLHHIEHAVTCRDSPRLGNRDTVLAWLPRAEYRGVIADFFDYELAAERTGAISRTTETRVATFSPSGRVQGRMRRS